MNSYNDATPMPSAKHYLKKGIETYNRGLPAEAIKFFSLSLELDSGEGNAYFFRALARQSAGDRRGAMRDIGKALRLAPKSAHFRAKAEEILRAERRRRAAPPAAERPAPAGSGPAPDPLQEAAALKDAGRVPEALARCREVLRRQGRSFPGLALKTHLEWTLGLWDEARAGLARLRALAPGSLQAALNAAAVAEDMEEYGAALAFFSRGAELFPESAEAHAGLARLRLWRGERAEALRRAGRALALDPGRAEALRARAGAAVLARRLPRALTLLDRILAEDPRDLEARVWRAEALRLSGRAEEALREIVRARALWPYPMGALLNLALLRVARGERMGQADVDQIMSRVPQRMMDLRATLRFDRPVRAAALLRRALARMGGNRSLRATFIHGSGRGKRLVRALHFYPRDTPVQLQAAVRFGDHRRVLRQFASLMRRSPREGYLYSHRGEVLLWAGRYADAARDFLQGRRLSPALLWPTVGLSASRMLTGRFEEALGLLEYARVNGGSDSIMCPWRGEIYRRLGRSRDALAELAKVPEHLPFRPGKWINVALAKGDLGDLAGQREIYARLRLHLPEFLADARDAAGVSDGSDSGRRAILEKALELLRGNRSSWMYTYMRPDGRLRLIRIHAAPLDRMPPVLQGNPWAIASAASGPVPPSPSVL